MATLSPPSRQARTHVRRDSALRRARTCYDHLAGVAGVELLDVLVRRRWLRRGPARRLLLTPAGARALAARGVGLERARRARRTFAAGCLDWTERRWHLRGALGAAVLAALVRAGVARRAARGRAVTLRAPLSRWLA
ncbi:MAG: hypothetical protein A3I14_12055 [Candidatus Rokubacteria bacterium RIFCSPLOWO2_02_FULL_73_56]|nr:MAG: hypothetical protein A2050_09940 [Candidatus Rokubacteria bacterium GWA2_73_35]OGK96381.1 MAG: hypothetical protein A3D33_13010 [Candidatus Rokubacteria bacterium RIFCSPHIGHO2_02_FULL_73_26]OGL10499.1 MAG: hypothetical protein A3I14_12055 [Candidatus Rokubacteria bacterium RIFCSPLOWO2_02_FULL_73_56]OGL30199.1 MAG: hypothetical protein A3G44_00970 [Candidatus Rokubacteria bacterium RIFCSPLOWO2_12_FULL_73_47]